MALGHHQPKPEHQNPAIQQPVGNETGQAAAYQRPTRGQGGMGGHPPFSFKRWIRLYGLDLLTMAAMGAVGLGVYEASPAPSRNFAIYFQDGQIVYPQFAYPLRKNIIPIWAAALLAFFVPFVFFVIFQIRHRSFEHLTASTLGVLTSLITGAVFQVFLKWLIGGFRPHFLDVCKPNISANDAPSGIGFQQIYYDRTVCTGDESEINDSLESFVSGHTTAAAAGFVFLSLYLNAQLKIFADYRPAYWKHVLFFAPLLGVVLIAGSLTIDAYHNWYDVLAGGIIGTCCAFAAFRMTFAAIWDFRFNHVVLPRTESLFLRHPSPELRTRVPYDVSERSGDALATPFSHEGGWAPGAVVEGAPGDAIKPASGSAGFGGHNVQGNGLGGHGAGPHGAGMV